MLTSPKIVLKTENLSKWFNELLAVNNLSLEVQEGEIFGFLGPNGAGKSTSINMMCGLLKSDSGKVYIQGTEIQAEEKAIKAQVGVCPQNLILWSKLTCMEQLIFVGSMYNIPKKTAKERGEKLLKDLGLWEKRNKLSSTLSGGMQRRLNIILALIHDPNIIVLDEPEAGLDPQSRVLVRDYIKSLARKKTVILTTHNMDEAERVCDRIAIIDHGSLLITGTPHELKKSNGYGDVLEIEIANTLSETTNRIIADIKALTNDCTFFENKFFIKEHGIVEKLGDILNILKSNQFVAKEIKFRENTLEDVFISLTGRKLRE